MTRARDLADSADKDIAGTLTLDALTVDGDAVINDTIPQLQLMESDTTDLNSVIKTTAGQFRVQTINDAADSTTNRFILDHATGDISFYEDTGTTAKLFWDASAESLGIGTSSPATPLHIVTSGNTAATFHSTTDNSNLVFTDASTTANVAIGTVSGDNFRVQIAGSERMRINSSGNVGIGTSSPAADFHVNSGASNLAGLFESTDAGATITLIDNGTTGGNAAEHGLNAVGDQLEIRAVDNLAFETNGAEHIRILSTGNVGIGHATPDSLLHLKKTDSTAYSATATDGQVGVGPTIYLENPANSNTTVGGQIVFGMRSTEEQARIGATGGTTPALTFGTSDAEAMRISSGNVGIGESDPAYQLHVSNSTDDDGIFIGDTSNDYNKRIVFGNSNNVGKAAIATRNHTTFGRKHLDFHINAAADNTTDINYSSDPCLALMDGNRMAMNSQTETSVSYVHRFYINDDRTGSTNAVMGLRFGSTASRRQINFMNPNGIVGRIQTSGSATSYVTSSDYRLKENVVDITDGIERVKQLSPKRFNFISDADLTVDGFIAHETQTVVPEAIDGVKDETHAVGDILDAAGEVVEAGTTEPEELEEGYTWTATGSEPVYQGIDQSKIVPVLTAALKEAIAKIEALETRLTALEG